MKSCAALSLREFARIRIIRCEPSQEILKIAPSRLSEILNGKQGLSVEKARAMAAVMKLSPEETQSLLDSVEHLHSKSPQRRAEAEKRIEARLSPTKYRAMTNDSFETISNWYHFAIVQLLEVEGFESSPKWIGRALGITVKEAREAIDRLLRLGILVSVGETLQAPSGFITVSDGNQSLAIQSFHKQILTKALEAIEEQSIDERDLSSVIFAMPKKKFKATCEVIKDFRRSLVQNADKSTSKDELYSLSIQLVQLTKN